MEMITPDGYQKKAHEFASYGENPVCPFAGLAEEAGEVCGKFAKFVRKNDGLMPIPTDVVAESRLDFTIEEMEFRDDLKKELGDVCWMVAECATLYGLSLADIMTANIAKLTDRKARGVIVGEGDNR